MNDPQQAETLRQLVSAGTSILGTSGEAAVTVRSVAALAGISPASVQRYFPTRDDLLVALYEAALRRDTVRLTLLSATLRELGSQDAEGARNIALGLIVDACGANAQDTLARVAALAGIARRRGPHSAARAWAAERRKLLAHTLQGLVPQPERTARFLLEFLTGLELLSLGCRQHPLVPLLNGELLAYGWGIAVGQSKPACPAWFRHCASQVLQQRHEEEAGAGNGRTPHARQEILAASARILAEHGPAELTHRAVAKEADIASSLVSYHFRSKNDLLYGAYRYIHDRFASAPTARDLPAAKSPTQTTLNVLIDTRSGAKPAYVASLEAIIAAAHDPDLADFAWRTRMTRGVYYLHPHWDSDTQLSDADFNIHAFSVWTVGATLLAESCWSAPRKARCLQSRFSAAEVLFSNVTSERR